MNIIVEPEQSDPWLHQFAAAGMSYCLLEEQQDGATTTDDDGDSRAATPSSRTLTELVGDFIALSARADTRWVAQLSGPLDEVVAAIEVTGRAVDRSLTAGAPPSPERVAATTTLVLTPHDPALRILIEGNRESHRTLALLQVPRHSVGDVIEALARGDDRSALAAADRVVVQQASLGRSTFAVRDPGDAAPAGVPTSAPPAPGTVRRSFPRDWRVPLIATIIVAVLGAVTAATLLRRSGAPTPAPGQRHAVNIAPAPTTAPAPPSASAPPRAPAASVLAVAPPPRTAPSVGFDAADGQVVLYGGSDPAGTVLGDTWTFAGGAWKQAHPAASPPARSGAAITYNPATRHLVLFGGTSAAGRALDDTWVWDGSTWIRVATGGQPSSGQPVGLVDDDAHGALVLVTQPRPAEPVQTWTYGNGAWSRSAPASGPAVGRGPAMAYDQALGRIVLVDAGSNATWIWNGASWTRQPPAGLLLEPSVPIRLAFDPQTRTLLLVQSASAAHPQSTTWSYAAGAWQQLSTPTAPEVVGGLVSDPGGKNLIALAGRLGSQDWNQVWTWRSSAWGQ